MSTANTSSESMRPAWYWPTIGKYLFSLLAMEITLYVSEQFEWFEFNRHKNWTVLVNAAVVAVSLLLLLVWIVVATLFRGKPQFGLSSLMGLVCVVGVACGWFGREWEYAKGQLGTIKVVASHGATSLYSFDDFSNRSAGNIRFKNAQFDNMGLEVYWSTDDATPQLLRKWLGDDLFSTIRKAFFAPESEEEGRRGFEGLKEIRDLRELRLAGPHITDATLARLNQLPCLDNLEIYKAPISNDGLRHLSLQKNLRVIKLHDVPIDDAGLRNLEGLENLNVLELRQIPITDAGIVQIACLKELQSVLVSYSFVTDKGVSQLQSELPNCRITRERSRKTISVGGGHR
jgi:hypothetical protein